MWNSCRESKGDGRQEIESKRWDMQTNFLCFHVEESDPTNKTEICPNWSEASDSEDCVWAELQKL